MGKPQHLIFACAALLSLSACDETASIGTPDRSGAPRGTFSSNGTSVTGNSAPERGEWEKRTASSGSASASTGGASTNTAAERDPQNETLTGSSTTTP